jgi:hypothetical protein
MRLKSQAVWFRHLLALAVLAGLLVWPASASAGAKDGDKVDPAVAAAAATSASGDELTVLVYGSSFATLGPAAVQTALPDLGAVSVTVRAGDLATLAAQPGVSYVASDPVVGGGPPRGGL